MERIGAAGKHPENQGQLQQEGVKLMKHIMKTHGIKDPGPKEQSEKSATVTKEVSAPVELNLDAEWQRQGSRFVELGYHAELKLTPEAYIESLPKFEPQPEEYKGRFDVPMLVETRIPWVKQAELAGITVSEFLKTRIESTQEWESNHFKTPNVPFAGWFNAWGQEFPNKIRPFDARDQLALDASGAGPFDGIAQEIHHPEVTENGKYFDLIGFSVGSDGVPCLYRWYGRPRLNAYWSDSASDDFRPLVRGKKIVTR